MFKKKSSDFANNLNISLHQDNCFDLLRHIAALAVLISHHFALTGHTEPLLFGRVKLGTVAVFVFFTISGYLITKSFCRSSSITSYFKRRLLRILPALFLCSFLTVFVICGFWGRDNFFSWIFSFQAFKSFISFSFFILPHNLEAINYFSSDYFFRNALNGSLWTLKFEFLDYILVFIIFFFLKERLKSIGAFLFLGGAILILWLNQIYLFSEYYLDRLALLSIPFAIGGCFYSLEKYWIHSKMKGYIAIILLFFLMFTKVNSEYDILFLFLISSFIITVGFSIKDRIISGKFDISYGIYIYAFPIQQVIINKISDDFVFSLILSVIFTLFFAFISWHFVERRFIFRKSS